MKTIQFAALAALAILATACPQRMDDHTGDDVVDPNPDPDPDPVPTGCRADAECVDNVDCNRGVCKVEDGTCSYVSTCTGTQVCNVQTDVCETPTPPTPTTHSIACFQTGDTLYLTIAGQLTNAVYGGTLANPRFISVASDQIAGSWNVNASTTSPRVVLSDAERTSGYVASASINLPSANAQRFTLMVWSDDNGGYARRLDLGDWTVSGDGCARIADGVASGTDGYIIGRAPLCANACDDGITTTADACTPTGCTHGSTTNPGNGTISCTESGGNVNVTISGGIVAHLAANASVTPTTSWKVMYGSSPGSWQIPYAAGSTKDWKSWVTDGSVYTLQIPNDVTSFNFALTDGGNSYWFDLNEFTVSGSTCAHPVDGGSITRTATTPPPTTFYGSIRCEMTSETGSLKRKVTVAANPGRNILDALIESPSPLPSPTAIQYGGSDGWQLPYTAGSNKPQLSWVGGTATYNFFLDPFVDDFNFFVVDPNDPADSVAGGDYFALDRWSVVNVGAAGCVRIGGGVSIN